MPLFENRYSVGCWRLLYVSTGIFVLFFKSEENAEVCRNQKSTTTTHYATLQQFQLICGKLQKHKNVNVYIQVVVCARLSSSLSLRIIFHYNIIIIFYFPVNSTSHHSYLTALSGSKILLLMSSHAYHLPCILTCFYSTKSYRRAWRPLFTTEVLSRDTQRKRKTVVKLNYRIAYSVACNYRRSRKSYDCRVTTANEIRLLHSTVQEENYANLHAPIEPLYVWHLILSKRKHSRVRHKVWRPNTE